MRIRRFGVAVAAGATILAAAVGGGAADAATIAPEEFPHTATLKDGVVTVSVSYETLVGLATCSLYVLAADQESQARAVADAVNAEYDTLVPNLVTVSLRRKPVRDAALENPWTAQLVGSGGVTATWDSERADSSYVIYQECHNLVAIPPVAAATVYKVTEDKPVPPTPPSSFGSLGSLLP